MKGSLNQSPESSRLLDRQSAQILDRSPWCGSVARKQFDVDWQKWLKGTEHQTKSHLDAWRVHGDISPNFHKIVQAKLFRVGPCIPRWSVWALDMTMTYHDPFRHPKWLPVMAGSFLSRRLPSLFARHLIGCSESCKEWPCVVPNPLKDLVNLVCVLARIVLSY